MFFFKQFEQFSRTLSESARIRQENIWKALDSLAYIIASYVEASGQKWPTVTMLDYERHAAEGRDRAKVELIAMSVVVTEAQKMEWINFTQNNYMDWIEQSYQFDPKLNEIEPFPPQNFHDYMTKPASEGVVPADPRSVYAAFWLCSPPVVRLINWNQWNTPDYDNASQAAIQLGNETAVTRVRPYAGLSKERHKSLHDNVGDEQHPHSFVWFPVHERKGDYKSNVVAVLTAPMS